MRHRAAVTAVLALALVGTTMGLAQAAPVHHRPRIQLSFYDGHKDAIVVTDSSGKVQAHFMGINFAPGLRGMRPSLFPKIFRIRGAHAGGQLLVLGSEPGEPGYSPIWHEIDVRWKNGVTPTLLTSDTDIDAARMAGDITTTPRKFLLNASVLAKDVANVASVTRPKVFKTFYDGHRDGMLATDVSNKAQAMAKGITFVPSLGKLDPSSFPELYIVQGRHAAGQLMILGSEPGEPNYSPLWLETNVRWRHGVTPTVIKSDTQVDELIAMGKVVERGTHIVLNCPVTSTP
jgi:hypothetical protein